MKRNLKFNEDGSWTNNDTGFYINGKWTPNVKGFSRHPNLDSKHVADLQASARSNYIAGQEIRDCWHPVYKAECIRINDENETLTEANLDRQSYVDSAIHTLVNSLVPDSYAGYTVEWNIERIAGLREQIQDIILNSLKEKALERGETWTDEDTENFEMEFYPFFKYTDDETRTDKIRCDKCNKDITDLPVLAGGKGKACSQVCYDELAPFCECGDRLDSDSVQVGNFLVCPTCYETKIQNTGANE